MEKIKENLALVAVMEIAVANKNTSGIDFWLTIRTTIAKASSWTGSSFHLAAFVDACRFRERETRLTRLANLQNIVFWMRYWEWLDIIMVSRLWRSLSEPKHTVDLVLLFKIFGIFPPTCLRPSCDRIKTIAKRLTAGDCVPPHPWVAAIHRHFATAFTH